MKSPAIIVAICGALAAGCVATPFDESEATGSSVVEPSCALSQFHGYASPLQQQLGCTELYFYWVQGVSGSLGAAFCPDTDANRARLTLQHIPFDVPGFYNDCLTVPTGKLFAVFAEYPGPGCPTGCTPQ